MSLPNKPLSIEEKRKQMAVLNEALTTKVQEELRKRLLLRGLYYSSAHHKMSLSSSFFSLRACLYWLF